MQQTFVKLHCSAYLSCNRILTSQSNIELLRRSNVMLSLLKKRKITLLGQVFEREIPGWEKKYPEQREFYAKMLHCMHVKNPFVAPRLHARGH